MNCLSHAHEFLDVPSFAAGTCIPDWLGMWDRGARVRSRRVQGYLQREDLSHESRATANGILQHFADDAWFHESRAFVESSLAVGEMVAGFPDSARGHRPRFVGHILVELLLDAMIEEKRPGTIKAYYDAMAATSVSMLEETINAMAIRPVTDFERFMDRYLTERFLEDYLDDERLLYRLNRILHRVQMTPLPGAALTAIARARDRVRSEKDALLQRPTTEPIRAATD